MSPLLPASRHVDDISCDNPSHSLRPLCSQLCRAPTSTLLLWVFSDSIIRLLVRLAFLESKTSLFNNTSTERVVTNWCLRSATQLVTTPNASITYMGESARAHMWGVKVVTYLSYNMLTSCALWFFFLFFLST